MSIVICSLKSRRKIVHYTNCRFIRRIAKANRITFPSLEEALERGYRLCNCCPTVGVRLHRERAAVTAFCREHDLTLTIQNGVIHVESPCGGWKILPFGRQNRLFLYHRNTFERLFWGAAPSPVPGYHSQAFHSRTILGYLQYIDSHDQFRASCPVGTKRTTPKSDSGGIPKQLAKKYDYQLHKPHKQPPPRKGTKRARKEAKRQKRHERIQAAFRVQKLIDALHSKDT